MIKRRIVGLLNRLAARIDAETEKRLLRRGKR